MTSHEELAAEIKLRKCVSKAINVVQKRLISESLRLLNEEIEFRSLLQDLVLQEATKDPDKDPHPSTGINVLEDLLKKILTTIKDDFLALTTDKEQGDSFRAHIIHAVKDTLAPISANEKALEQPLQEGMREKIIAGLIALMSATGVAKAGPQAPSATTGPNAPSIQEIMPKLKLLSDEDLLNAYIKTQTANTDQEKKSALSDLSEKIPLKRLDVKGKGAGVVFTGKLPASGPFALDEDVDIDIIDKDDEEKFIDVDGDGLPDQEEKDPKEEFGIEGADETGRNRAYETFNKIDTQIIDAYSLLGNEKDKEVFYDYLITNLKLHFDKFENQLSTILGEPTTDTYEKEKAGISAEEEPLAM